MVDDILPSLVLPYSLKRIQILLQTSGIHSRTEMLTLLKKNGLFYRRLEVTEDPTIRRNVEKKSYIAKIILYYSILNNTGIAEKKNRLIVPQSKES